MFDGETLSSLLLNGVRYRVWHPDSEERLEGMVKEHAREIFGVKSFYFDIRRKIKTRAGIGSIPDGYVIDFSGKQPRWFVVEVELSSHPIYEHVVTQLTKFVNGLGRQENRKEIVDSLYWEIKSDPVLEAQFKRASSSSEIYRTLTDVIATKPTYVIITDKKTGELEEALKVLSGESVEMVEFKTYEREGIGLTVHAHLFEVIAKEAVKPPIKPSRRRPFRSWNERLEWINPSCRQLVKALIKNIEDRFLGVKHEPCGRHYCFYRLIDGKRKRFAALIPMKNKITVAILAIPQKFKDENEITWSIKGWFFRRGLERRFDVKSQADFDYALRLIKQAYEFSLTG